MAEDILAVPALFGGREAARSLETVLQDILDLGVDTPELVRRSALERRVHFRVDTKQETLLRHQ